MKVTCKVNICSKKNIDELPGAWTSKDFLNILDLLDYSDESDESERKELAMMALTDQAPEESAATLLVYRLSEKLTDGQIKALCHEMQEDEVAEEYPDIFLQHELFNINQLLYQSFNGQFPHCQAIKAEVELQLKPNLSLANEHRMNELIIKALLPALGDHSIISRLYGAELTSGKVFKEADGIIWIKNISKEENNQYNIQVYSSKYWLNDLPSHSEYQTVIELLDEPVPSEH